MKALTAKSYWKNYFTVSYTVILNLIRRLTLQRRQETGSWASEWAILLLSLSYRRWIINSKEGKESFRLFPVLYYSGILRRQHSCPNRLMWCKSLYTLLSLHPNILLLQTECLWQPNSNAPNWGQSSNSKHSLLSLSTFKLRYVHILAKCYCILNQCVHNSS